MKSSNLCRGINDDHDAMTPPKLPSDLTAGEFDEIVNTTCGRWSAESRQVVRCVLVQKESVAETAANIGLSTHRVNILLSKFAGKIREFRLLKFKDQVPPEFQSLEEYRQEIETLARDGYTEDQIVLYLEKNGCKTTAERLASFMSQSSPSEKVSNRSQSR